MFLSFPHPGRADASPLHRLPAGWKMGAGLAIIVGTIAAPPRCTGWFAGVFVGLALMIWVSRIPLRFLLRRLLVLMPFVLGVALANAFQPAGRAVWAAVAVKSTLCLLTVLLISSATPVSELLRVLKRVRTPGILVTTIALMNRYLFVMIDESERMRRARLSRTFRRGHRANWRSLATVLSQLFVRTTERADRVYQAMCARGWK
jgi:cobalt/nickel transport system permease protein